MTAAIEETATAPSTIPALTWTDPAPLARALHNALIHVAGPRETRPEIQCVRFEWGGTTLTVVATDRYRLSFEEIKPGEDDTVPGEPFTALLDASAAKAVLAAVKAAPRYVPVTLTFDVESGELRFSTVATSATHRLADYSTPYPAWRGLVPDPDADQPTALIGFNPKFLADLAKVQAEYKAASITVRLYGSSKPARVDFREGPTVLLMPVCVP